MAGRRQALGTSDRTRQKPIRFSGLGVSLAEVEMLRA